MIVDDLVRRIRRVAPVDSPVFGVFVTTDIQGFTTVTEKLSPAESASLLNAYFALTFPPIEREGGNVSQINGDGILAFWLGPTPDVALRRSACLAALEIAKLTGSAAPGSDQPALPTRISIHVGPITLARLGASGHHEYRAVGDAANTASRIEQLSKHLGTRLLVSEDVVAGLDDMLTRPVGAFRLAGKVESIRIRELIAPVRDATVEQVTLCDAFAVVLNHYRDRRWYDTASVCRAILKTHPHDGPSRFYLALATGCIEKPPPASWDGVVHMAAK
jgi:adenylate cyclase